MKKWSLVCALVNALGCSAAGGGESTVYEVGEAEGSPPSDAERLAKFTEPGEDSELVAYPGVGEYSEPACAAGQYIYLMTVEKALLRFDPRSLRTEIVGSIDCPTTSTTNAMAVDRQGNAWIGFHSGEIHRLAIDTLRCEPSGYSPGQLGWKTFGMSFVSDVADSEDETLYLSEGGQPFVYAGLGKVDPSSLALRPLGKFNAPIEGGWCEVNGRGDGRLFAFCPGAPAQLVELDKTNGATISATVLPFGEVLAFAFAQWGGDFILFTSVGEGSRIDAFTPGQGTRRIVEQIDFSVVGAGVSTCAPTWSPPR